MSKGHWHIRVTEDVYMQVSETVQLNLLVPPKAREALKIESKNTGIPVNLLLNDMIRERFPYAYPDEPYSSQW